MAGYNSVFDLSDPSGATLADPSLQTDQTQGAYQRWLQKAPKHQQVRHRFQPYRNNAYQHETTIEEPAEVAIEMEDLGSTASVSTAAETTALLGEAAASTSGVSTGAGVIVGGAIVGGVLGSILTKRGSGIVLKGSEFIGPGNPVDTNPARSRADQVAKEHDIAYGEAQKAQEVIAADERAIAGFREAYAEDGNYHAKIGEIGLTLKKNVEKLTGILYPPIKTGTSTS